MILRGRVWKFGDGVGTESLAPAHTLHAEWEARKQSLLPERPEFVSEVRAGDIIVAGKNWGNGAIRDRASQHLKDLGVGAVVAESFGRIHFRTCVAIALPSLVCPGITVACDEGDDVSVNLETGHIQNFTQGTELSGQAYGADMLEVVRAGGLMKLLEQRAGEGRLSS